MASDAEVVEVLAEWFLGADWHKGTSANEISSEALSALRSAGYAVVKAADWSEIMRLAATSIINTRPLTDAEIERTRQLVAEHGAPFTKDPTNA